MYSRIFHFVFFIVAGIPVFLSAQRPGELASKNRFDLEAGLGSIELYQKPHFGIGMGIHYFPLAWFGTGLSVRVTRESKTPQTYSEVAKPVVDYTEVGWMNQINIPLTKRISVGAELSAGGAFIQLGDNAKETTRWAGTTLMKVPGFVDKSSYFLVAPGIHANYQLSKLKITLSASRRKVFGKSNFDSNTDFEGYTLLAGAGFSIGAK